MVTRTIQPAWCLLALAATIGVGAAGCSRAGAARGSGANAAAGGSPAAAAAPLSGSVTVDGSSTVLPVSTAMAAAFQQANAGVRVAVRASGTGGGFKKFCSGGIDIADASRPINAAEAQECRANHVDYIELPVAFDSLSVVVSSSNAFVTCLTVAELKRLWEPHAAGTVMRWNQIRAGFPDAPIALFGPGTESGTFDYFTLAIVGTESRSRNDFTRSEDDEALASGIAADPNALGYFGYAYYQEHKRTLKAVAVDNGGGCIAPSADTVADNRYEPLSRPVFVYVSTAAAARPEVNAFARFYVSPENARRIQDLGYVPLPTVTLLAVARRLDARVTGSVFGGRGSVLGLTADSFRDEDRIQNALVR